jgi:hypothetical protein
MIGGLISGKLDAMTDDDAPVPDDAPLEVRMRQGMPTRLEVDGVRCRFGLNTWRHHDQSVHFTVRRGDSLQGFDVRWGDRVDVLGRQWTVSELSVPESGAARVVLREIRGSTA